MQLQKPLMFILLAAIAHSTMASADDSTRAVVTPVAKSAAMLTLMHKKARRALINSAQDNTFQDYFHTHDTTQRQHLKSRIEEISLGVQKDFHVEEMCLIDPNGSEITRIVGTKIAHDLSSEEASADFFEPGFAQSERSAYVSPAYMSPDADRWVVAYVTPVVTEGHTHAILHYEHGLDAFHRTLDHVDSHIASTRLVVSEDGWIIWNSETPIKIEKQGDSESPADYFEQFSFAGRSIKELVSATPEGQASITLDGITHDFSYRKVEDWYVVGFKQRDVTTVSESAGH